MDTIDVVNVKINQINDMIKKEIKNIDNINKQCDKVSKYFAKQKKNYK